MRKLLRRRGFLQASAAAVAAPLATPVLSATAEQRVLKFIPQADLAAVDRRG